MLYMYIMYRFLLSVLFILSSNEITSTTKNSCTNQAMALSSNFVVVGLNPALQKRLILEDSDKLITGNVHRVKSVTEGIGGKGQDVAIALNILNVKCELVQFVGSDGSEGDKFIHLLGQKLNNMDDMVDTTCDHDDDDDVSNKITSSNVNYPGYYLTVRTKGSLRTCTTIVSHNGATELVEPSGFVDCDEVGAMIERVRKEAKLISACCIMGSMPPGCPEDMYANLVLQLFKDNKDALCLIDSVVGLQFMINVLADLHACSQSAMKINLSEIHKLSESISSLDCSTCKDDEVEKMIHNFVEKYGGLELVSRALGYILVTNGAYSSYFVELIPSSCNHNAQLLLQKLNAIDLSNAVEGPLYPIGAGDTVAAGTLAAWSYLVSSKNATGLILDDQIRVSLDRKRDDEDSMLSSFKFGLACGSASCLKEENSEFAITDALNIFEAM